MTQEDIISARLDEHISVHNIRCLHCAGSELGKNRFITHSKTWDANNRIDIICVKCKAIITFSAHLLGMDALQPGCDGITCQRVLDNLKRVKLL